MKNRERHDDRAQYYQSWPSYTTPFHVGYAQTTSDDEKSISSTYDARPEHPLLTKVEPYQLGFINISSLRAESAAIYCSAPEIQGAKFEPKSDCHFKEKIYPTRISSAHGTAIRPRA